MAGFGPDEKMRRARTFAGSYADETPLATSFRVYTPAEIRTSRLPRAPLAPPVVEETLTPQKLARMFGIGIGALVVAFVAFLVIGNLTDDAKPRSARVATAAIVAPPPAPIPPPVVVEPEPEPLQVIVPLNDFEIADEGPPARSATKGKGKGKQNKRRIVRAN